MSLSSAARSRSWSVALVFSVVAAGMAVQGASPAQALSPQPATTLTAAFKTLGDTSGAWSGADGTASVQLPDGRVAWLFSDTYLGSVNADGSRAANTTMVNNSLVVQSPTGLSTVTGGTSASPTALLPPVGGEFFWVGSGSAANGNLYVLYNRYTAGTAQLDFGLKGTTLAVLNGSTLAVTSTSPLPLGSTVAWGSDTVTEAGVTYVFGSEYVPDTGMRFVHLAKTNADYSTAWQFWTGSSWSSSESASARLLSGVGTAFGVQKIGTQWVLVTQDANTPFSPDILAYPMAGPTGPFSAPIRLLTAPEPATAGTIVYDTHVHPEVAPAGSLLWTYNVNSLTPGANEADARLYRPRFVQTAWPIAAATGVPTVPAAPSAVDLHTGSATVSWSAVAGATSYRVYRRDVTAGQSFATRENIAPSTTSASVGSLRDGHTYELRVTAMNANGESAQSSAATLAVSVPPASTPGSVVAAPNGTTGGIKVSWAASTNATSYDVYVRDSTSTDPAFTRMASANTGQTSVSVSGLGVGTVYQFYVVAKGPGGASGASATVTGTPVAVVPAPPTSLTAVASTTGTVDLAWTASTTAGTWYWVYQRDVTAGETAKTKLPLPVTGTSMTAGYLASGHAYAFSVTAYDNGGESAPTAEVSATASIAPPGTPTLTAVPGNGQAVLTWTTPAPNLWYVVKQRNVTAGETAFTELPLPVTSGNTMTAGYLLNDNSYDFVVAAVNGGGRGPDSAPVRVTPTAPAPPPTTGLAATPLADGSIRLDWTAQLDTYFWIWKRDVTAGESFSRLAYPTDQNTATATFLTNGHVYEFQVQSNANGKDGPLGSTVRATSAVQLPPAPTGLTATAMGNATIHLDWSGPTSVYYWVYSRDVTAGQTTFGKSLYPTDKFSADMGLLVSGHTYEFKVAAENVAGQGNYSNTAQAVSSGGLPNSPGTLTAQPQDGAVGLSWGASSSTGVSYRIYQRDATNSGAWKPLPLPTTALSMVAGGLTNGVTYEFRVVAVNVSGASGPTNVASARPLPLAPSVPAGLVATAQDGGVALSWNASTPSSVYYLIEYRQAGGAWVPMKFPTTARSLTVAPLANGTTYQFHVRASNLAGESPWSAVASAKPMPPRPSAPPSLTATAGDRQVTISWGASTPSEVYYLIDYRRAGTTAWTRMLYPTTSRSLTVTPLANGQTYEFRVFAQNLTGVSTLSSSIASAKPMPPLPSAPAFTVSEGEANLTVSVSSTATDLKYYRVSYTNATRRTLAVVTTQYTSLAYLPLPENEVYSIAVQLVNMTGTGPATTKTAVTKPTMNNSTPRRLMNIIKNGSDLLAGKITSGLSCKELVSQTICFNALSLLPSNLKPANPAPMTIGDYMLYPYDQAAFLRKMRCDAVETQGLAFRTTASRARDQGPHLDGHEAKHSDQWTQFWGVAQYAAAWAAGGRDSPDNPMEQQANLYWGGYVRDTGVNWCVYS